MRKMCAVIACYIRIIRSQIRTNCLAVYPFKIIISLPVRRNRQIKISCAHIQGLQSFPYFGIRPQDIIRCHNGFCLRSVTMHDFQPCYIFFSFFIINDMRPVHLGRGMQRGFRVLRFRRNYHPAVLPVIQILRSIASDSPMPYVILSCCFFLIFPIPVIGAVKIHDGTPMSLDPVSVCVQPYLAGTNTVIFHSLLLILLRLPA